MGVKKFLKDGLISLVNTFTNTRNPTATNQISSRILTDVERRDIAKNGLGRKIMDIKAGYALRNSLVFDNEGDEAFYNETLKRFVRMAAKSQISHGRGIIVLVEPNTDLGEPMTKAPNVDNLSYRFFSGDMVFVPQVERDLMSPNYFKPISYTVRGFTLHPSRVIDFTFIRPDELEAPFYRYGGISLWDIIYDQLINDKIIERSSAMLAEKGAQKIWKLQGFRDLVQTGQQAEAVEYINHLEALAGVSTANICDKEDDIETITMQLTGIKEINESALRRISLVTSIPLPWLVGENVQGLNSTGDNERLIFEEAIADYQEEYLFNPLNRLMEKLGKGKVSFKEAQFLTPDDKIKRDSVLIDNAVKLEQIGLDGEKYLVEHDVAQTDTYRDNLVADEFPEFVQEALSEFLSDSTELLDED